MKHKSLFLFLLNIFCVFANQKVDKYVATSMYDIPMVMEPISAHILKPHSSTSQTLATFDLAYTTANGQNRLVEDLPKLMSQPRSIPSVTKVVTGSGQLPNPTKIGVLPQKTLDNQPSLVWWITAGNFNGIQSTEGAIYLLNMETEQSWRPSKIFYAPQAVFRHTEWVDMDIDGRKDCVTVKETKGDGASLIWLRQPSSNKGAAWVETRISNVTDDVGGGEFRMMRWPKRKRRRHKLFAVAGRRTNQITVYWSDDVDNDWTQTHRIKSRVIAKHDQFVHIEVGDLNGDQRPELIVTVAAISGRPGRLMAYEAPMDGNFGTGRWRSHVLAEWTSKTKYYLISPRSAHLFYPKDPRIAMRPNILVSGGSDGKVYVVSPINWNFVKWEYKVEEIFSDKYSVGTPAVQDVDGDGDVDIFIPSGKRIHVMKYGISSNCKKLTRNLSVLSFGILSSLLASLLR